MVAISNAEPPKHTTCTLNVDLIVFYHPKDYENVRDIICVAKSLGISKIAIVKRPGSKYPHDIASGIQLFDSLDNIVRAYKDLKYIILETYGSSDMSLLRGSCEKHLGIILGAEDYGIPRYVTEIIPDKLIIRLPMKVASASYNVVTALVILLYELIKQCTSQACVSTSISFLNRVEMCADPQ